MITATFFQFILFTIDDDSGNLLVHKNENDTEQRWEKGNQPPPEIILKWTNKPTACAVCEQKKMQFNNLFGKEVRSRLFTLTLV